MKYEPSTLYRDLFGDTREERRTTWDCIVLIILVAIWAGVAL